MSLNLTAFGEQKTKDLNIPNIDIPSSNYEASERRDPSSGRPLLRAPKRIPETFNTSAFDIMVESPERVAVDFDPTVPQKLSREQVSRSGDRMSTTVSQNLRSQLGAGFDEHLDHSIALALSGSNVEENLQLLPARENQKLGQKETELMNQVINGEISLVDAQLEMAKAKGVRLPESEPKLRQKIQNELLKVNPKILEKGEKIQNFIRNPSQVISGITNGFNKIGSLFKDNLEELKRSPSEFGKTILEQFAVKTEGPDSFGAVGDAVRIGEDIVEIVSGMSEALRDKDVSISGIGNLFAAAEETASVVLRRLADSPAVIQDGPVEEQMKKWSKTLNELSDKDLEIARSLAENIPELSLQDPRSIGFAVVQNAPMTIGALLTGAGATLVGGPGAGVAAMFGYSAALEGGFARIEAEQIAKELGKDITEKQLDMIMVKVGTANGLLETFAPSRLLNRLSKTARRNILREIVREMLQTGLEEAGTEFLQETVNNIVQREIDPDRAIFEGALESAVVGGISGGIFGGGGVLTRQAIRRGAVGLSVEDINERIEALENRDELTPEEETELAQLKQSRDTEPLLEEARKFDTAEEFLSFHKTGEIKGEFGGKDFFGSAKEANPIFLKEIDINGKNIEFRQSGKKLGYTKTDSNGNIVRNKKGESEFLNDDEIKSKGLPELEETITAYDGERPIGFVGDSFGATEIVIRPEYQKQGIGTELLIEFMSKRPNKKLGQMTPEGEALVKSVYKRINEIFNQAKQQPEGGATPEDTKGDAIQQAIELEADKIQKRRDLVRATQDQFGLTATDVRKVSRADIRNMTGEEFDSFVRGLQQSAVEQENTRQAKAELIQLINDKEFEKVENYRRTQGFPPITQMTAEQMREYMEALSQFEVGDEFLTERTLEVIDRNETLQGVKTMREVRNILAEEIKRETGKEVKASDLENLKMGALDNLRYDTALAESNPVLGFFVQRTQAHILVGEKNFFEIQEKVNELAKKANKSRNRSFFGSVKQFIIPQHEAIVQYLESDPENKQFYADKLTKEELDYANFVQEYYGQAYDHLVQVKELYGSRYIDQYFTHIRKTFLEEWKDNGIVSSFRNVIQQNKEDQIIANIIDQDTGIILPKSKFFRFTMERKGGIDPSQNVTRVFLNYVRMFERKKMLDKMVPEIEVYTQSLTPKDLTQNGLEVDRSLKTFINKYLNTKRGRKENFGGLIKQNGPADLMIRMGNTFVSLIDLGLALGPSVASTVGEQMMTYQALGKIKFVKAWKRRLWDVGIKRMKTKEGKNILKQHENFVGRNIWTELAEPDKGFGERATQAIFGVFSQSSAEANKIFLLGSLSKEELQSGELSAERLAELRLEAGRWRDMGNDVKSIVGATSLGRAITKYKGWAIPIVRTTLKDISDLSSKIKNKQFKEALTGREIQELYRAIEMTAVLVMIGSYILSDDDDNSFLGRLKARAYMEAMTFLGGIDPTLFISTPRVLSFLGNLANNLKKIALLEQYETDTRWGDKGDLKGLRGLQRQLTPGFIEQFQGLGEEKDGLNIDLPDLDIDIPDLDINIPNLNIDIPNINL